MKTCSECQHMQEAGNFCGKCGTAFISATTNPAEEKHVTEAATTVEENARQPVHNTQTSEQIEAIKVESKKYFNYFLGQIKEPSAVEDDVSSSFKNGLISMITYFILTAIAVYTSMRGFIPGGYGFSDYGPTLIQVIFYVSLFFVIIFTINVTSVFLTSKFFSTNMSFKETFTQFSHYYVVPLALSLVAILFGLLKSIGTTTFLITASFSIAFAIIPVFVMIKLLTKESKGIDRFYAFLFYLVLNIVTIFIAILLIADSMIGEVLNYYM